MKRLLLPLVIVCLVSSQVHAADAPTDAERLHRAKVTMWTGTILAVGGLIAMPITAGSSGDNGASTQTLIGVGVAAVGTVMIWKGAQDARKVASPNTSLGVFTGRATGIQVRRSW